MDLSKYRDYFNRLVLGKQCFKQDIYKNLISNNDRAVPLITNKIGKTETRVLESVIPLKILREPDIKEFNTEYSIVQEARILRHVLPKDVKDSTIYELIKKYNCAEVAINAYFEEEMCCYISR